MGVGGHRHDESGVGHSRLAGGVADGDDCLFDGAFFVFAAGIAVCQCGESCGAPGHCGGGIGESYPLASHDFSLCHAGGDVLPAAQRMAGETHGFEHPRGDGHDAHQFFRLRRFFAGATAAVSFSY